MELKNKFVILTGSKGLIGKAILKELKKNNFNGWLVVEAEQDPKKANPLEYAKIGYNYLSKTVKDCGFDISEK